MIIQRQTMADMTKESRLTFRMSEKTRAALERAAESERRSVSDLAVIILDDWLSAHGFMPRVEPRKGR
jgi:hypothetical protein